MLKRPEQGARAKGDSDLEELTPVHACPSVGFEFTLIASSTFLRLRRLTMTLVAKVKDAPDIDDLRFPFFVETPGLRIK